MISRASPCAVYGSGERAAADEEGADEEGAGAGVGAGGGAAARVGAMRCVAWLRRRHIALYGMSCAASDLCCAIQCCAQAKHSQ